METPAEPAPKHRRRWWSISLRAMLLLVLAIGIPMGWWARQAQLQRHAVAMIEAANGSVVYDHEVSKRMHNGSLDTLTPEGEHRRRGKMFQGSGSKSPLQAAPASPGQPAPPPTFFDWASKNLGIDYVDNVVQVLAIGMKPGEEFDPARLADLPKLERLNIQVKPIKDDDLVHLEDMRGLRALCLANTKITDAGLAHVEKLDRLEDLILFNNGGAITDAGLARLKGLKRLVVLEVGGPNITDAGLVHLRDLPELRSLFLQNAPNVTEDGIAELCRALPQLKVRHPKPR